MYFTVVSVHALMGRRTVGLVIRVCGARKYIFGYCSPPPLQVLIELRFISGSNGVSGAGQSGKYYDYFVCFCLPVFMSFS